MTSPIRFSGSGERLLFHCGAFLQVHDTADGRLIGKVPLNRKNTNMGGQGAQEVIAFSPDGTLVAVSAGRGPMYFRSDTSVYELRPGQGRRCCTRCGSA